MLENIKESLAKNLGNTSFKGYEYLCELMTNIYHNEKNGLKTVFDNEYRTIAISNKVTKASVERALRYYKEYLAKDIDLAKLFNVKIGKRYTMLEFYKNIYSILKREGVFNG